MEHGVQFFPKGTDIIKTGLNINSQHSIKVSSSPHLTVVKLVTWQWVVVSKIFMGKETIFT
jgi:hypothetical protein